MRTRAKPPPIPTNILRIDSKKPPEASALVLTQPMAVHTSSLLQVHPPVVLVLGSVELVCWEAFEFGPGPAEKIKFVGITKRKKDRRRADNFEVMVWIILAWGISVSVCRRVSKQMVSKMR